MTKRDAQQIGKELNACIARLTQTRDQLNKCNGCGCLSLRNCPLRNPSDELSA